VTVVGNRVVADVEIETVVRTCVEVTCSVTVVLTVEAVPRMVVELTVVTELGGRERIVGLS